MVLVGILAEVGLLTYITILLEGSFISSSIGTGLCRENFLVEDFRRNWWKCNNTTFEVISTAKLLAYSSVEQKARRSRNVLPVTPHVRTLCFAVSEGNGTRVASVWMRLGDIWSAFHGQKS